MYLININETNAANIAFSLSIEKLFWSDKTNQCVFCEGVTLTTNSSSFTTGPENYIANH